MTSQPQVTVELLPAEDIALTVAKAQIERGEYPTPNVAVVCVVALARLVGRPIEDNDLRPYAPTAYDVQEDLETGHCRACGCTVWADQDLCSECDDAYRTAVFFNHIHADRTPAYLPPCEATP